MKKTTPSMEDILDGLLKQGMTICLGDIGICGTPDRFINASHALGVGDLTVVSNNAGLKGVGPGKMLQSHQVKRMIASYVREIREFERPDLSGELDLEFAPQGSLAECGRAGGASIPALTPANR